MQPTATLLQKIILFLRLFTPMALTQFSLLAGSFVAVFLTGQYSTADLAGVSVGYNIWIATYMGVMGILLGITPIVAQLLGAGKRDSMHTIIQHGFYLAAIFAVFTLAAGFTGYESLLVWLSLEPAAHEVSLRYMLGISLAIFPLLLVCPMRNVVDSHGFTHYSMGIMICSFFINVTANYILIFGRFGFPALGGAGAGYAVALSCWFNFIIYALILRFKEPFKSYRLFRDWVSPDSLQLFEQLRIGVPIGVAIFCEGSIFSIAGLLMTEYGTPIIAAHQAAMSFTNLFYCFPLSISMASTIVVAYEIGAKRLSDARTYANLARLTAIIIAALICAYSFTHMEQIAQLYTREASMVGLIMHFLSYAVFFAVIDAFGTPLQGILRGYKDVKVISYIAIGSYWGVCFPVAYIFSRHLGYGPYGVWIGLLTSVTIAGILYTLRLRYIQHKKFPVA